MLTADIGCLTDETNHLQIIGNYVYGARTGFRAEEQPGGKRPAANNVYVRMTAVPFEFTDPQRGAFTPEAGMVVGGSPAP